MLCTMTQYEDLGALTFEELEQLDGCLVHARIGDVENIPKEFANERLYYVDGFEMEDEGHEAIGVALRSALDKKTGYLVRFDELQSLSILVFKK